MLDKFNVIRPCPDHTYWRSTVMWMFWSWQLVNDREKFMPNPLLLQTSAKFHLRVSQLGCNLFRLPCYEGSLYWAARAGDIGMAVQLTERVEPRL